MVLYPSSCPNQRPCNKKFIKAVSKACIDGRGPLSLQSVVWCCIHRHVPAKVLVAKNSFRQSPRHVSIEEVSLQSGGRRYIHRYVPTNVLVTKNSFRQSPRHVTIKEVFYPYRVEGCIISIDISQPMSF